MTRIRSAVLALLVAGGWMALAPGQALGQKTQRDLITRAEIESSPKRSGFIYELIRSLRPHFLEPPRGVRRNNVGGGGSSLTEVAVFIGQNHAGGIDVLKGIEAEQVEEVRYFDPSRAEAEFGLTLGGGGAIVVKMYKGKPPEKP
jgi:hypothetical protein